MPANRIDDIQKSLQLQLREFLVSNVGGCEVRVETGELDAFCTADLFDERWGLVVSDTAAPHPGVDLDVNSGLPAQENGFL